MNLTEEQILALAPDDSSKKSGKEIANSSKWNNRGLNEKAMWGECQGSGAKPYRTQVDLQNLAFKCSCPSRKFPCKHGLGLLLNFRKTSTSFTQKESPDWVKEWIDKRAEKEEKKTEKKEKTPDPESQKKRLEQRTQKINQGIEELQLFIKDTVRNGVLLLPEKANSGFRQMAKRMIDSQAQGLSNQLKSFDELNYYRESWPSECLSKLAKLYLICEAFKNLESLETGLKEDIKSLIGFNHSTEELKQQTGIVDDWIVLCKEVDEEDQLTIQRHWLYGVNSKRYALILHFAVRSQPQELTITPGTCIKAELVYYPGNSQLRALIKKQEQTKPISSIEGLNSFKELNEQEAIFSSSNPFAEHWPYCITNVKIGFNETNIILIDQNQDCIQLVGTSHQLYKTLALTGGQGFTAALLGQEGKYSLMGVWFNNQYAVI